MSFSAHNACEIKKANAKDISGLTKYCHQLCQHFAFILNRHSTSCWTPHRADLSLLIKIIIYFSVVMQCDGLTLGNNQVSSSLSVLSEDTSTLVDTNSAISEREALAHFEIAYNISKNAP